ncbi:hypothetical protein JST56_02530 [Candidatus Dependentiae bacterium]|nr:hypothetical protein [Candidatus Dependentiae bacterium]
MRKLIFLWIIVFLNFENDLHADLSGQLAALQQSLVILKTKLQQLSQSLTQLKTELESLKPERTFGEIDATNPIVTLKKKKKGIFDFYDVKVLNQHFKKATVTELATTNLWLKTIDPQFARDGWLCGFHSIKNAFYLCKLLTFPQETFEANKAKLIQKFQGGMKFLRLLEWPKELAQQPKIEIPLNVATLGREAVFKHLAKEPQINLAPAPWAMTWLHERIRLNYPEAARTSYDPPMQYRAQPKPALYSVMYNPIDLPSDLENLTQSMQLGKTNATSFMKKCLKKMIIVKKFYPEDDTQEKFTQEDVNNLKKLSQEFKTSNELIAPILWSYETDYGNHWVTVIVIKKGSAQEILLADPDIHGEDHSWSTQNEAIIDELIALLTNPNYF